MSKLFCRVIDETDLRYLQLDGGNIVDNVSVIGDIDHQLAKLHFGRSVANTGGPREDLHGIHWLDDTGGDFFVGSSPAFPDFYVQRSCKAGTTVTDTSQDATNLFQGNWGSGATPNYPFIDMNWAIGDGSVGNFLMGEDGTTYIRDGSVTIGYYDGSYGGGGLILSARMNPGVGAGAYLHFDETGSPTGAGDFVIRTMSGSAKPAVQVNAISFAGTRLTVVRAKTDNVVALGDATHRFTNLFFTGKLNWSAAPTYTTANVTTDRALDATGDTLVQVADVLGTLIADLKTLGVLV